MPQQNMFKTAPDLAVCRFVKYEFVAQPGRGGPVTLPSSTLAVVIGGLTPTTTVSSVGTREPRANTSRPGWARNATAAAAGCMHANCASHIPPLQHLLAARRSFPSSSRQPPVLLRHAVHAACVRHRSEQPAAGLCQQPELHHWGRPNNHPHQGRGHVTDHRHSYRSAGARGLFCLGEALGQNSAGLGGTCARFPALPLYPAAPRFMSCSPLAACPAP